MKPSLAPGVSSTFTFRINGAKTVPALYPEAPEFQAMPEVLATGYLVGLLEWACIRTINPHLDWPSEQSLGTHVNVSHLAATPPGLDVTVMVKVIEVQGRRVTFEAEASDGVDIISKGTLERVVVERAKFDQKVHAKARMAEP